MPPIQRVDTGFPDPLLNEYDVRRVRSSKDRHGLTASALSACQRPLREIVSAPSARATSVMRVMNSVLPRV